MEPCDHKYEINGKSALNWSTLVSLKMFSIEPHLMLIMYFYKMMKPSHWGAIWSAYQYSIIGMLGLFGLYPKAESIKMMFYFT